MATSDTAVLLERVAILEIFIRKGCRLNRIPRDEFRPHLELIGVDNRVCAVQEPSGKPRSSAGVGALCLPLLHSRPQLFTCATANLSRNDDVFPIINFRPGDQE